MNRMNNLEKPENLKFDYNLFDAVRLEDNKTGVITGYGIYDNQYWLEICYPDGVHLGAADYFSSDPKFYGPHIIKKLSEQEKQRILKELASALKEYSDIYEEDIEKINSIIALSAEN